jgi:hypothetical protein
LDDRLLNEHNISNKDDKEQDTDELFLLFLHGDHDNSEVVDSGDEENSNKKENKKAASGAWRQNKSAVAPVVVGDMKLRSQSVV